MEYNKAVVNRLKRIRTIGLIVSMNLEQCVRENIVHGESTDQILKEAVIY